ncbi:hypothetical protein DFH09DRAFT_1433034, partial [Mycena vulgaris]
MSSLFSHFFPREPKDRLNRSTLVESLTPTNTVGGLLMAGPLEMTTTYWLEAVSYVGGDEARLVNLDRCVVDQFDHLRSSTPHRAHEKVAFTFHLASPHGGAQVGQKDHRAACVQACPPYDTCRRERRLDYLIGLHDCDDTPQSAACDTVQIDANYYELLLLSRVSRYPAVQTFTISAGTPAEQRLTALDCAILASVITERAKDSSHLSHMCMWFATVFFLAAHRICEQRGCSPVKTESPRLCLAGHYGKVPLVDPKSGRLLFGGDKGLDGMKEVMRKGMTKGGLSPEEVDRYLKLLDNDEAWAHDEEARGADPIQEIVRLFEARRHEIRERLAGGVKAVWEKRPALRWEVDAEEDQAAAENLRQVERVRELEAQVRDVRRRRILDAQAMEEGLCELEKQMSEAQAAGETLRAAQEGLRAVQEFRAAVAERARAVEREQMVRELLDPLNESGFL